MATWSDAGCQRRTDLAPAANSFLDPVQLRVALPAANPPDLIERIHFHRLDPRESAL
jgi:hypothetical protein